MPAERRRSRLLRVSSADHGLSAMLMMLVILIFVIQPLTEIGVAERMTTTLFFALFLLSGVWAVAGDTIQTLVVGTLVTAAFIVRGLRLWFRSGSLIVPNALLALVFCMVVAVVVLTQVFRRGPITFHRIQGAIAAYLLLGMAWAFAYEIVALEWPSAFTMPAAIASNRGLVSHFVYFSLVTLTTVGYGDVTAVHPVARSLVMMEALVGQLFPAVLLARLVSMELYQRHPPAAEEDIGA